jgi:hypothetical protein
MTCLPPADVDPQTRREPALGCRGTRARMFIAAFALSFLVASGQAARAAKWHDCPEPPFPTYPSEIGASNSPFIQAGHDLTIVLNSDELAQNGGFALEDAANEVAIAFHTSLATTIPLSSFGATALAADALTFVFPDSNDQGLGLLAGPVEVTVSSGGRVVAHIAAEELVALPPSNDVTNLLMGNSTEEVMLGAVGADGDVWFPAHFQGEPMAMSMCPGDYIIPVNIEIGGAILKTDGTKQPLSHLRNFDAYFGDVNVEEYNLYGKLFMANMQLVHVAGTLGVSICKLNDAVDMILRLRGPQSWASSDNATFAPWTKRSASVPLVLEAPPSLPGNPPPGIFDSFDNVCPNNPSAPVPEAGQASEHGKGPAKP